MRTAVPGKRVARRALAAEKDEVVHPREGLQEVGEADHTEQDHGKDFNRPFHTPQCHSRSMMM